MLLRSIPAAVTLMCVGCSASAPSPTEVGICEVLKNPKTYLARDIVVTDAIAVGGGVVTGNELWYWLAGSNCKPLEPIYVAVEPTTAEAKERRDSVFYVQKKVHQVPRFQQQCRLTGRLTNNTGFNSPLIRYKFVVNDLACGPRIPDIEWFVLPIGPTEDALGLP